jgi:hypothetical protein
MSDTARLPRSASPSAKDTVRIQRPAKPASKDTVRIDRRPAAGTPAPQPGTNLEDFLKQQKPHVEPPQQ